MFTKTLLSDDDISGLCKQLSSLLDNSEPGLITWQSAVNLCAKKLNKALNDRLDEGKFFLEVRDDTTD